MKPERKAKAFKKAHELSKKFGISRATKAVGVSRYGYYKWLERNELSPISRFQKNTDDKSEKEGPDNMRV
jgi:ACT domain-containing protein